jgi:hypothetical protein
MGYWGGAVVAGRTVERDRPAEFRAEGTVEELAERVAGARAQLAADLALAHPTAPPRRPPPTWDPPEPWARTQGGVVFHIYEELSRHLGQLELTRDVLLASD